MSNKVLFLEWRDFDEALDGIEIPPREKVR